MCRNRRRGRKTPQYRRDDRGEELKHSELNDRTNEDSDYKPAYGYMRGLIVSARTERLLFMLGTTPCALAIYFVSRTLRVKMLECNFAK